MTTKVITIPKELKPEFRDKTTNDNFFIHHKGKIQFPNGKQFTFKDKLNPKKKNIKVRVHMIINLNDNQKRYFGRFSAKGRTQIFESKRFKAI